jgi:SAM-dependent methyltransferase
VSLNPASQYADDRNLRARQRLWELQRPPFDLVAWVLDLAEVDPGDTVLDAGCGNGGYLRALRERGIDAVGCDLSHGMLQAARPHPALVNGDVTALPFGDGAFDVVLAPHMLYHVADRTGAARELRRVLRPDGRCVIVTNGGGHVRALRDLVEAAVRQVTPGWEMRSPATHVFSLDDGADQLATAFSSVTCVRPADVGFVTVHDADVVADYVASTADHYQPGTDRPWAEVVADVRRGVQAAIDTHGAFVTSGDVGAFVCR